MRNHKASSKLSLRRETVRLLGNRELTGARGAVDQTLHTITGTLLPQPQPPQQPIKTLLCPHPPGPQPEPNTITSQIGTCS
jgi:hypothetical protein